MIAVTLFLIKDKEIGTFSNTRDSAPNLYTSCSRLSSSREKCSSGKLTFPFNSVFPIPSLKSRKSSWLISLSHRFLFLL